MSHTPTPWRVEKVLWSGWEDVSDLGFQVGISSDAGNHTYHTTVAIAEADPQGEAQALATAAHIVKCVNAHDELVETLRGACEWIEEELCEIPETCPVTREFRTLLAKLEDR